MEDLIFEKKKIPSNTLKIGIILLEERKKKLLFGNAHCFCVFFLIICIIHSTEQPLHLPPPKKNKQRNKTNAQKQNEKTRPLQILLNQKDIAQSAEAVEYTDCNSAER